ncbi:major capsid protein [Sulfurovum sp. XTW-4]|uniref:Major capsid protein n=1 Tax=Sulfurovum xiamenensis TaxID=3019066 RepID=A0ABT7QUH9_9BACT|nr:major capsid protein [Sulfurovum xiamenensis]MDM5264686.1 major capsid protein [Sulfurovum xiamenensis]
MAMVFNNEVVTLIAMDQIKDNLLMAQTATNGAIEVGESIHKGDFLQSTIFDSLGEASRRDPTVDTAATPKRLSNLEQTDVKLYFKELVFATYTELARYGTSMEAMQTKLGEEIGNAVTRYILKRALISLVAAIGTEADSVHTTSVLNTITINDLNMGVFKFGDKSADIVTFVSPSIVVSKLIDGSLNSSGDQISYGAVYQGETGTLGRSLWMVDSDALTTTVNKVLGLAAGAIMIDESEAIRFFSQESVVNENAGMYLREEGAYTLKIKGFKYVSTQGANPTDATLGAAASWALVGDRKGSAGVLIKASAV